MRIAHPVVLPAAALLVLSTGGQADAAWSGAGAGAAAARAMVMPGGVQPTARSSGTDVTLRWPAALLPNGTPVAGYLIQRYDANGNPMTVQSGCAGTLATTTCTEHNVPAGGWSYTDTPVQDSWSGQPSPASGLVIVGG